MNTEEVNRIIAEFMDDSEYLEYLDLNEKCKDTKELTVDLMRLSRLKMFQVHQRSYLSLDALVPVWEKLGVKSFTCEMFSTCHYFKLCKPFIVSDYNGKSINEAAAIATAKAILEAEK